MRITDIYIKNYRAFYGDYHLCLGKEGKNLMVYGENGSGKSSFYTALQDLFKASVTKVDIEENIFIKESNKNTASIGIDIKEAPESSKKTTFTIIKPDKELISSDKVIMTDANKVKGFFDYRSLLLTHLGHKDKVDLFGILIGKIEYDLYGKILLKESGILQNSINRFSKQEIGKEWEAILNDTCNKRQVKRQQEAVKNYLSEKFNPGLDQLLKDIEKDTNIFMKYFGADVKITLEFDKVVYHGRRKLSGNNINLKIDFFEKPLPKHQFFLNEARLSALAISFYLASIRVNPLTSALKILVLDDLLIGLDMSNRLPLLEILNDHFIEVEKDKRFQIFMTTFDKVWFDLVNNYFSSKYWKYIEIYTRKLDDQDFEIPIIKETVGYITKAKAYLYEKDYKASAVYIRTEFESLIKEICVKKELLVPYKTRQKDFDTNDFWEGITKQTDIDPQLVRDIEIHRGVVMNPFSHHDLEKPEFERELSDTILAIEKLGKVDIKSLKRITIDSLKAGIEAKNKSVENKNIVIERLREKIKEYSGKA